MLFHNASIKNFYLMSNPQSNHQFDIAEQELCVPAREELQEMLGPPPGWILRSGISVVLLVLVLGLTLSWFIRYPDKLEASMVITSKAPPVEVIAPVGAYLDVLLVEEEEQVEAGQLLAVLENPAGWKDVQRMEPFIGTLDNSGLVGYHKDSPPEQLQLGELQAPYASFLQAFKEWRFYLSRTTTQDQIEAIAREIAQTKRLNDSYREQLNLIEQEFDLIQKDYRRTAQLREERVVSDLDLEKKEREVHQAGRQGEQMQTSLIQNKIRIEQLSSQQQRLSHERTEGIAARRLALLQSLEQLRGALDQWKKSYQLRAPITGKVTLYPGLAVKTFLSAGEIAFTVLPSEEATVIGRGRLPMQGAGKIEPGSPVQIQLDAYPHKEYGVLNTTVDRLLPVPVESREGEPSYFAEVSLDLPLTTTYGRQLPFQPEMTGRAYLISENRRLLERFFEEIINLVQNR